MKKIKFLSFLEITDFWIYLNENVFDSENYSTDNPFILKIFNQKDVSFLEYEKILEMNSSSYPYNVSGPIFDHNEKARNKFNNKIPFQLELEYDNIFDKNNSKMCDKLQLIINHILTSFEIVYLHFGLPRFILDGRKIFFQLENNKEWFPLTYEVKKDFIYPIFNEISPDSGHYDVALYYASNLKSISLSLRLFSEAIKFYYEQNYRGVLINCCSSFELEVSPKVTEWLLANTLTKSSVTVENVSKEIGNPMRLELYFASINPEIFKIYNASGRDEILKGLKSTNSIRNKVIHGGYIPTRDEAKHALNSTGSLIRAVWIDSNEYFKKEVQKYDD